MSTMRAKITVNLHDTHIGIWQEDAQDRTFRADLFAPLIRAMRARGWHVGADPSVRKNYRILNANHRLAARGTLRASIEIAGRCIKVEFWATTWPMNNRNGRRYDFDKLARMDYLDRLRFHLEARRIVDWLRTLAPVTVKQNDVAGLTALQRIEKSYAESWHTDKTLGRPVSKYAYNHTARDGLKIEHGATVWFVDNGGRIGRGTAYYNLNSMWLVAADKFTLLNLSCGEIFCTPPTELRTKRNERQRRGRLEAELAAATRRMDFARAGLLRRILFGAEPVFMIWAKDHDAYYRPNYSGYTTDTIAAGRYTRAEAEAEVRRVPHELMAVDPEGKHLKAADFDRRAA
ncbi:MULTISPECIES: hypothetical protein [unclassified Mesorhizobium]|uniref:hypothetical protein n=1 Tax=unclassified Mesorhizobium TaxID=325217 RepID=UPI001FE0A989|nr:MULTISPECIES: hypothetical protein [unclassified Mesorhizobium]